MTECLAPSERGKCQHPQVGENNVNMECKFCKGLDKWRNQSGEEEDDRRGSLYSVRAQEPAIGELEAQTITSSKMTC